MPCAGAKSALGSLQSKPTRWNNHRQRSASATRESAMKIRHLLLVTGAAVAVSVLQSAFDSALAQAAAKLAGQVASPEGGNMEGVVVTAKKAGSTIAISVVSDAEGKFIFPAAKIEPGDYTLRIRAIGYELDGPKTIKVEAETAPVADAQRI